VRNPSRSQEQQDASRAAWRVESGHEGLHQQSGFVDGVVLTNDVFFHPFLELNGVWQRSVESSSTLWTVLIGVPLLLFVFLRITAHVFD
jgi:hypothetical protein